MLNDYILGFLLLSAIIGSAIFLVMIILEIPFILSLLIGLVFVWFWNRSKKVNAR